MDTGSLIIVFVFVAVSILGCAACCIIKRAQGYKSLLSLDEECIFENVPLVVVKMKSGTMKLKSKITFSTYRSTYVCTKPLINARKIEIMFPEPQKMHLRLFEQRSALKLARRT
ncbi:hypothetical protein YC2023_036791 [Brassica napus]